MEQIFIELVAIANIYFLLRTLNKLYKLALYLILVFNSSLVNSCLKFEIFFISFLVIFLFLNNIANLSFVDKPSKIFI